MSEPILLPAALFAIAPQAANGERYNTCFVQIKTEGDRQIAYATDGKSAICVPVPQRSHDRFPDINAVIPKKEDGQAIRFALKQLHKVILSALAMTSEDHDGDAAPVTIDFRFRGPKDPVRFDVSQPGYSEPICYGVIMPCTQE